MYRAVSLVLLLPACGGGVVPVYIDRHNGDVMAREFMVQQAADQYLGLTVKFVDRRRGALFVDVIPVDRSRAVVAGRAVDVRGCSRYVFADEAYHVIASEMAHGLGLDGHVCEPDEGDPCTEEDRENLMVPWENWDGYLTPEQLDIVWREAGYLDACWPG